MKKRTILYLIFIFFTSFSEATLYEDAEDGTTLGWIVYCNTSGNASISNIEENAQNHAIRVQGAGLGDGYKLLLPNGERWQDINHNTIRWSMKYSENFTVYISARTTKGHRYFVYKPIEKTEGLVNQSIKVALGLSAKDGTWHTFTHNLEEELDRFESNNHLESIEAFLIRGSGDIDNIETLNHQPMVIHEDAEDKNTDGWVVYSNSSGEATISNVTDTQRESQVIKLEGLGRGDGYKLYLSNGKKWEDHFHHNIKWSMKYSENYTIYIEVNTVKGKRYLTYTPKNIDQGWDGGQYINIGLGESTKNGVWQTFYRDLRWDFIRFEPDNRLLSINGFLIRGSGSVDDIILGEDIASQKAQSIGSYPSAPSRSILLSADENALFKYHDNRLDILDVSDPTEPNLLYAHEDRDYSIEMIRSHDGTKIFSITYLGLKIEDITDLSNPVLLGTYPINRARGLAISVDEKHAFIASEEEGLIILDIENLSAPAPLGTYTSTGIINKVVVSEDQSRAFLAVRERGIEIVNIENSSSPFLIKAYQIEGWTESLALSDDEKRLYVGTEGRNNGLKIINISNEMEPTLMGAYTYTGIREIVCSKNLTKLFVGDSGGFKIIDISNPENISLILKYHSPDILDFALSEDEKHLFISDDNADDLMILAL